MRAIGFILLVSAATAQAPSFQPVGTVSQLMINIIYPTSDAIFYIERTPPKTDVEWNAIRNQALMLAESVTSVKTGVAPSSSATCFERA